MSPRRNWDSPTPSLASDCAPSPGTKGGGHTRLQVRGWGVPIPTTGEKAQHSAYSVLETHRRRRLSTDTRVSSFSRGGVSSLVYKRCCPGKQQLPFCPLQPLRKIFFLSLFLSRWVKLFSTISDQKSVKKSNFSIHLQRKSKRTKTCSKFGLFRSFLGTSGLIRPRIYPAALFILSPF